MTPYLLSVSQRDSFLTVDLFGANDVSQKIRDCECLKLYISACRFQYTKIQFYKWVAVAEWLRYLYRHECEFESQVLTLAEGRWFLSGNPGFPPPLRP